ncbi:hypothetical protein VR7878_00325 [Vibrio ruber DSM 16370]|uniref:Uncharacterized protein n=1 Tax=Vibrio ruber (strain DSM 16370 / JCM 11486 / BCRC 17186 / CECT 7878 / LMG 23124 / VR1) TaxID=1123498 RepID=A0A1R4LAH7_VIBR1|nr:hypothetical protein [Vibrio ruber]SJN53429.1 hypothetical protein VR7878_00325 [Vibrio ruber DSM 16370]
MSEPLREKIVSIDHQVAVGATSHYESEPCQSFACHQYLLVESLASEAPQSYSFWDMFFF